MHHTVCSILVHDVDSANPTVIPVCMYLTYYRGFQFPTDMHLEPEYWADSGSLDEVERHHHDVITNQLFTVSPKTGTLAPGESTSILCSFK